MSNIELAKEIASQLLAMHNGPKGTRMAIMRDRPDFHDEDNLGGRNQASMERCILEVLAKSNQTKTK